jgi:ribose transport system substrate-binding protein
MNEKRTGLIALLLIAGVAVWWYRSSVYNEAKAGPPPKLIVVTGGSGPFWQAISNGAKKAARDLGANVEVMMPVKDEDVAEQMKLLSTFDFSGIDGVAISPLDADKQTRTINQLANDAFVVTIDSDAPLSMRHNYVGASNIAAGMECAKLLKETLPEGGKVVVLMANVTKQNMDERQAGFEEVLNAKAGGGEADAESQPNYEIVDFLVDEGNKARCEKQLRELLKSQDDLNGIVGMNGYHGPILVKILKDDRLAGKIKVVAFDAEEGTLNGVSDGTIYATIAQDPYQYGYEAIGILNSFCQRPGEQLPLPGVYATMTIGTRVLKKDNVEEFRDAFKRSLNGEPSKDASKATPKEAKASQPEAA